MSETNVFSIEVQDIIDFLEDISSKIDRLVTVVDVLDSVMRDEADKLNGNRTHPDDVKERVCSMLDLVKISLHQRDDEVTQIIDMCIDLRRQKESPVKRS